MRILLFTIIVLSNYAAICGQETKSQLNTSENSSFETLTVYSVRNHQNSQNNYRPDNFNTLEKPPAAIIESGDEKTVKDNRQVDFDKPFDFDKSLDQEETKQTPTEEKFHWKPALIQSGIFLGIQHGFRMTQVRTRRELNGPFFRDWGNTVKSLRGWRDGDNVFINYTAHPLQGGLTGRIFVNNSDAAKKQEFGKSKDYWASRLKAMAWSAVWSTQFELGPISEASIGNVGLRPDNKHRTAYVDLVITPTFGTGVLVGEDAIDKYLLKNWIERKNSDKTMIKIFRTAFTPTTSFSNLLRGKYPWKRDARPL